MYCNQCGRQLEPVARFCPFCGTVREGGTATPPPFRAGFRPQGQLVRSRSRRAIAGVCAGFADHYGWDLNLVRVLTVVITLFTVMPFFAYIAAWIIIPDGQYALPFSVTPPPPSPGVNPAPGQPEATSL